ncbi:ribosomal protein S18-alanine N-acetyltransferase [Streptococcus halotolerans]|uniref:ribosomal protein S18-alanine N-acetyltransferase n=1 Tax=Streptococcus halotolerans TaxID=1814128 RepID=UPI0007869D0D|nr:ribosomal protein S18-alanine N-acetyltransferase [Streptococcus halotolerans]
MTISNGSNLSKDQLIEGIFKILEDAYGQSPWSRQQILADYNQNNTDYFFLSENDQIIGFLALQGLFGEMELTNIAVLPSYQGRGLSKQLMANLEAMDEPIFLEVRTSNKKAQNLYQQFGFKKVGYRKNYYHRPTEDAVLMKREAR